MSLISKQRASEVLENAKGKRIAVIGDVILDCYLWGKVTRISPEAPVPIVHVNSKTFALGGAANVMQNITSLGGRVIPFSVSGEDDDRKRLLELMHIKKIEESSSFILPIKDRVTIVKKRIMAGNQHLARIDYEDTHPIPQVIIDSLVNHLIYHIKNNKIDAVIFEDYAKGVLNDESIMRINIAANEAGIPTALDPHSTRTYDNISDLTFMTPNLKELYALYGYKDESYDSVMNVTPELVNMAERVFEYYCKDRLLVTLGAGGMALFGKNIQPTHIPTRAREVFDVTGAGDTVIGTMLLARLGGATWEEAADLSNYAAGIVVGKIGTATVTVDELLEVVEINHAQTE